MSESIVGIPASSGRARGRARWIRSADDLEAFQVGEVILAKMTSPDWGEVFRKAVAVVTQQGGMLCHAAIVAREEGIPAVVGVGDALEQIANDMLIMVDGEEGEILVLEEDGH